MKLFHLSLFATVYVVLECSLVRAIPDPPKPKGDVFDVFQKCKKEGKKCNKKKLCCEEFACEDKKCVKKESGPYELEKTYTLREDEESYYEPFSMSDDGNVIIFDAIKFTYVLHNPFRKSSEGIELPSYDMKLEAEYDEGFEEEPTFDPDWSNAVSGDGQVFAVTDYERNIVRTYRLEENEAYYPFGEELYYGETDGSNFGTSVALNKNGTVLIVGADHSDEDGDQLGFIQRYDFMYEGGKQEKWGYWMPKGDKVFGEYLDDELGRFPLEISSDGNRIAVGGGTNGFATVYDWDEGAERWTKIERLSFECEGWQECVCDLTCIQQDGPPPYNDPAFGEEALFMSSDGEILAIGDSLYDPNRVPATGTGGAENGAIYFYGYKEGTFTEYAKKLVGPPEAYYGWKFTMSDDGMTVVVSEYDPYNTRVLKLNKKKKKFETIQEFPGEYLFNVKLSRDGEKMALLSWKEGPGTRLTLYSMNGEK
mmetsp:Transcript_35185/g.81351  ORF Transcript_35185/g.81351 Transcript_35185/m.81351 type:complete len:480 (-) Transcript_35185:88-1527(-)